MSDPSPTDRPLREPVPKPVHELRTEEGHEIELEKTELVDVPRHVVHGPEDDVHGPLYEYPIPERPLHLCPNCEYNLTGLTSRRCPECGKPFTLADARIYALDQSPKMRRLYRLERLDRASGMAGLLLLIASLFLPQAIAAGCASWPASRLAARGLFAWYFIMPMVIIGVAVNTYWEIRWSHIFFAMGLLSAFMVLLVCVC